MNKPVVLGIETSCDETAVALYRHGEVLAEAVHSQVIFIDTTGASFLNYEP